jgi:tetratricopeptide (TPR) repeat protein
MLEKKIKNRMLAALTCVCAMSSGLFADATFDKLLSSGDYKAALDYADEKIAISDRDASTWVKIAKANSALGMNEKALACYLVSWRLNPNDYQSLLGCAIVYNNMKQPSEALNMAKKALEVNFTAEASWEYAKACIALNRSAEAKTALEKVIQSDPKNAIANRELGNIYYNEKDYIRAASLLAKDYKKETDGFAVYKIGKSYNEAGKADSAIIYLKDAIAKGGQGESFLELGRAYTKLGNNKDAVTAYEKVSSELMTGADYYNFANAKNNSGDPAGAVSLYESAINRFGETSSKEALIAREKAARSRLVGKNYDIALKYLSFIVKNDASGSVVPDGYFLLSDAYMGLNDSKNAIASLEKVISITPKNVEAYARLADLYQKANMPDQSKNVLESMVKLSPNDPGIYLSLGNYYVKVKNYTDARAMFDKSNSLKTNADALEGLAISDYYMNQFPLAKTSSLSAIKMNGDLVDARIILGNILLGEKNYKDAQTQFEIIVKKRSEPEYLSSLAECYLNLGMKDKLAEVDRKIVGVNSQNVDSRVRLAAYAEENKNNAEAVTMYKELSVLKPEDGKIVYKLYELSNTNKENVQAMIYLKKYLILSPDNADAHGLMGDLYYNDNKMDDALSEYRIALKKNAVSKGFLKRYAEIVNAKGLQDEVIKALEGIVASNQADAGTYTTLGLIYEKKNVMPRAIEMYQNALRIEPSNLDALNALAASQAVIGDVNSAIITYEQIIMMNPKAVNEFKELGDLYARSFKQAEAIKAYKTYLSKDSSNAVIAKKVAAEAYRNKEYKDAVRFYGMALSKTTDDELYEYADACVNAGDSIKAVTALETLKTKKLKPVFLAKTLLMLADVYEKVNRKYDAVKTLTELTVLPGGKDPDVLYKRAFLSESDNRSGAIKYYEENCKIVPADYRNFLRLGVLLSENRETMGKSIDYLKRVTELGASVPAVWLELGKVYVKQNRDIDALAAFKRYAESDPQSFEANKNLGVLLIKTNKINEGMVYLEIANTLQGGDPVVMANLAKGYLQTGRTNEANDLLIKVKEKAADNIEVRIALYELYTKNGKKDEAITEIKTVAEKTNDKKHIMMLAQAYRSAGKIAEALDALENIFAVDPENVDAQMLKAAVLRDDNKYEDAIEVYKEVSFIKPDYPNSYFERAETHLLQSKIQWAETYYKRTLESDKKFALAELGLAKISKIRKDNAGYKLHLENAYKMDPDNALVKEELSKSN